MKAAPLPPDEPQRLQALRELLLLDTPAEEKYDRIVRFAVEQLDVPIALVSLVDDRRQWFKARVGIELQETPREIAFCSHAILEPGIFVVEDAREDERFADNPLVTGDTGVRFYAGAPLHAPGGERIGTLCVLDRQPRRLGAVELAVLEALRDLVSDSMAGKPDEAPAGEDRPIDPGRERT